MFLLDRRRICLGNWKNDELTAYFTEILSRYSPGHQSMLVDSHRQLIPRIGAHWKARNHGKYMNLLMERNQVYIRQLGRGY